MTENHGFVFYRTLAYKLHILNHECSKMSRMVLEKVFTFYNVKSISADFFWCSITQGKSTCFCHCFSPLSPSLSYKTFFIQCFPSTRQTTNHRGKDTVSPKFELAITKIPTWSYKQFEAIHTEIKVYFWDRCSTAPRWTEFGKVCQLSTGTPLMLPWNTSEDGFWTSTTFTTLIHLSIRSWSFCTVPLLSPVHADSGCIDSNSSHESLHLLDFLSDHTEECSRFSNSNFFRTDGLYPADLVASGSALDKGALSSTGQRETNLLEITFAIIISH